MRTGSVWCRRGDLNPHALAGTSPSIPLAIRGPSRLQEFAEVRRAPTQRWSCAGMMSLGSSAESR